VVEVEIDGAVVASGDDAVDLSVPGTYEVTYDCVDDSNNHAVTQTRTVVVQDTTCPEITMLGAEENTLEAGFPYADAGATATDTLDGDISTNIKMIGDTVTGRDRYFCQGSACSTTTRTYESCEEIAELTNAARLSSGYYKLRLDPNSESGVDAFCDFPDEITSDNIATDVHTYYACLSCFPMEGLYPSAGGAAPTESCGAYEDCTSYSKCSDYGMVYAETPSGGFSDFVKDYVSTTRNADDNRGHELSASMVATADTFFPANPDGGYARSYSYICAKHNSATPLTGYVAGASNQELISDTVGLQGEDGASEVGKYTIKYYVQDAALNSECSVPVRTVTVVDSLPPVITLHLKTDNSATELTPISQSDNTQVSSADDAVTNDHQDGPSDEVKNPENFRINRESIHAYTTAGAAISRNSFPTTEQNPASLMAERTTSNTANGWIIGAVASGMAGLALLAYGSIQRREHVVSVPV